MGLNGLEILKNNGYSISYQWALNTCCNYNVRLLF